MKKTFKTIVLMLLVCLTLLPYAAAIVPYTTYTYDIDGEMMPSPHAFVPDKVISSSDIELRDLPENEDLAASIGVGLATPFNDPLYITYPSIKIL